jgi:putative ABC transport system substrate-binding protein
MTVPIARRKFVVALTGAATWPLAARAQQDTRVRRIGVLTQYAEDDPLIRARIAVLRDSLRRLGWVEGRNLRIEIRHAAGDAGRLRTYAAELAALMPDVLIGSGIAALVPLQQATPAIPIVFVGSSDPVAAALVASIAHPGGNITGFALFEQAISVKWLELLKQIAPRVTRATYVYDPANVTWRVYLDAIEAGARSLGVEISAAAMHDAGEIDRAIEAVAREPNAGLIVGPGPAIILHRKEIIALAARHRLPAVYLDRLYVAEGGLASYGVNSQDDYRGAAGYIDRILKGEKPGDLPIQFATKFELVINTTTAKALGLEVPLALLIRADELIQ